MIPGSHKKNHGRVAAPDEGVDPTKVEQRAPSRGPAMPAW